jgi:hypothetical protein
MTKTTSDRWTNPIKLPDGHRIFQQRYRKNDEPALELWNRINRAGGHGVWAMADNSGHYPEDTDDGILWLDFTRDLSAGAPVTEDHDAITPTIPLMDMRGMSVSTITDACTLLWLSLRFDWTIYSMGKTLGVRER